MASTATHKLTPKQIETLCERHEALIAQIRLGLGRLDEIVKTLQTGEVPSAVAFDHIGDPIKEKPARVIQGR